MAENETIAEAQSWRCHQFGLCNTIKLQLLSISSALQDRCCNTM